MRTWGMTPTWDATPMIAKGKKFPLDNLFSVCYTGIRKRKEITKNG